jgi:cytochrome c-type biogenesis protein CcmF
VSRHAQTTTRYFDKAVQRLAFAIIIGAVTAVVGAAWLGGGSVFAPLAMGLGVFVIIGTLIEVVMRAWRPGLTPGVALKRTFGLPLSPGGRQPTDKAAEAT